MIHKTVSFTIICAVLVGLVATGAAISAQDRYSLKVPGGLAFSEFKGYETWQAISLSHNGDKLALILGNPAMIEAFNSGIPENGKPFPDGAKMVKIHWVAKKKETYPGQPLVAGALHDVDLMVKDNKRFADSGGWGYGAFEYETASDSFRPANTSDQPPQSNDAKCGAACHTVVKARDYVFTEFPKR
jgi:Cytochrome P460